MSKPLPPKIENTLFQGHAHPVEGGLIKFHMCTTNTHPVCPAQVRGLSYLLYMWMPDDYQTKCYIFNYCHITHTKLDKCGSVKESHFVYMTFTS